MTQGLPWWLSGKESHTSAGNTGLIPDAGRSHMSWSTKPVHHDC